MASPGVGTVTESENFTLMGYETMSDRKQFILVMLVAAVFVSWIGWRGFEVIELNNSIRADKELGSYPYPFRVLRVEGDVAVMTTLRSRQMSTQQALGFLFPTLREEVPSAPDWQQAERRYARLQARASEIVLASPDIHRVRWELDENWYYLKGMDRQRDRLPQEF